MKYAIVRNNDLHINIVYESEFIKDTSEWWNYTEVAPFCTHIQVPENLDSDCIKAQLNDDVIELVEDSTLTAAKVLAGKYKQIAELNDQTWTTILNEAKTVYSLSDISNRNEASILILSSHNTYESMVNHAADYVGDIFPNEAAVLAYAEPKLAASNAFGKWRLGILAAEAAQKAIILGS